MLTARFCGSGRCSPGGIVWGVWFRGMVPGGAVLEGMIDGGLTWEGTTHSAPWTDRDLWKHYLPTTSFAGGNPPIRRGSSHSEVSSPRVYLSTEGVEGHMWPAYFASLLFSLAASKAGTMDELMRLLSYHEIFHGKQFLLFILDLYPTRENCILTETTFHKISFVGSTIKVDHYKVTFWQLENELVPRVRVFPECKRNSVNSMNMHQWWKNWGQFIYSVGYLWHVGWKVRVTWQVTGSDQFGLLDTSYYSESLAVTSSSVSHLIKTCS